MKIFLIGVGAGLFLWGALDYLQMNNQLPAGSLLQLAQTTPSPPLGDGFTILLGAGLIFWGIAR